VAILARFNQGERSHEVRDALVDFCREGEWSWPWDTDIVTALATGWPHNPQLMSGALERIRGIGHPKSWAFNPAIEYLLRGCPGDDAVARMLADQLAQEQHHYPELQISEVYEALLVLQRDLSGLKLPLTLTRDVQRPLSMGTIGRIVAPLMIPDDFQSPIEIENMLPQGNGQQRPRLWHGQGRRFFFTFSRMRTKKWCASKVCVIW
jgi:hypothetical protein